MNGNTVIIPSAKIVPQEMQRLGKLPAIIYPVNKGIALDYMLDQYKDNANQYNIVVYEKKELVQRELKNYSNSKIQLIELESIKDLGYTIYRGMQESNTDNYTIINFADTIVLDRIEEYTEDCLFYAEDYPSELWTFFKEDNGVITQIIDKKNIEGLESRKSKLFVGVFKINHPKEFMQMLDSELEKTRNTDSFYLALMKYSRRHPLKIVKTENWFDIGHSDNYYNSKLAVSAREFNHISIDKERGILRKVSDEKEKFIGEILWYLKLPSDIEYVRPRIFSYSTSYNNPHVEMEYYAYHTVHELFLYGDLTYNQWVDIFKRIKFLYNDFSRYTLKDDGIKSALSDMYLDKTIQRLEKLKLDKRFQGFFNSPFIINGTEFKSLDDVCKILVQLIPDCLFDVDEFNIIHGDLCFTNIMVDTNFSFIKVIDPRGKFGDYDIYGDNRYELAKLFHSIDGKYDYIIKNQFSITVNVDKNIPEIDFLIYERQREFDLFECFLECFKDEIGCSKEKIELIEALLFLSMIPLHNEDLNHQYAMLATGIQILDRCTSIRNN